jgi:hypothetical protein
MRASLAISTKFLRPSLDLFGNLVSFAVLRSRLFHSCCAISQPAGRLHTAADNHSTDCCQSSWPLPNRGHSHETCAGHFWVGESPSRQVELGRSSSVPHKQSYAQSKGEGSIGCTFRGTSQTSLAQIYLTTVISVVHSLFAFLALNVDGWLTFDLFQMEGRRYLVSSLEHSRHFNLCH